MFVVGYLLIPSEKWKIEKEIIQSGFGFHKEGFMAE